MAECGAADQTSQNVDHAGSVRVWRSHTHREELVLCWKQARLHSLISASLGIPLGSHLWSLEVYFVQFPWFFSPIPETAAELNKPMIMQSHWSPQQLCECLKFLASFAFLPCCLIIIFFKLGSLDPIYSRFLFLVEHVIIYFFISFIGLIEVALKSQ